MGKNIMKKTTATLIDRDGVVRGFTKSVESVKVDTEPFFLTYSKQIMALYDMPVFNATTKVFWKLLEYAEWNTGKVYMNVNRRNEIMEVCCVSKTSYYRAVEDLVAAGLVTKDKDVYTIDEKMFWKGDRKTRNELMKAKLKVTLNPVFITAEGEESIEEHLLNTNDSQDDTKTA